MAHFENKNEIENIASIIRNVKYIVEELITEDDVCALAFCKPQMMKLCKTRPDGKEIRVRALEYLDDAFDQTVTCDDYRYSITKFLLANWPFFKEFIELADLPIYTCD